MPSKEVAVQETHLLSRRSPAMLRALEPFADGGAEIIVDEISARMNETAPNLVASLIALRREGNDLERRMLEATTITDQQSYDSAVALVQESKKWIEAARAAVEPFKKLADLIHSFFCSIERRMAMPMDARRKILDASCGAFVREQQRLQREREVQAAKEREERERQAKEQVAEEAKAMGASAEQIEQAVAAVQEPIALPVPTFNKAKGHTIKDDWRAEVTDMKAFMIAASKNQDLMAVLKVTESGLRKIARDYKNMTPVPGLRIWNEAKDSVRRNA